MRPPSQEGREGALALAKRWAGDETVPDSPIWTWSAMMTLSGGNSGRGTVCSLRRRAGVSPGCRTSLVFLQDFTCLAAGVVRVIAEGVRVAAGSCSGYFNKRKRDKKGGCRGVLQK